MRWRREVDALIADELAPPVVAVDLVDGTVRCRLVRPGEPVLDVAPWTGGAHAGRAVCGAASAPPLRAAGVRTIVLSCVGDGSPPAARRALLVALARVVAPGGRLLVVDHSRPRRRLAALVALVARPRVPGRWPRARWRRLAHPAARELLAAGFGVERLRLAAGERVQIVDARTRRPTAAAGAV